MFTSTAVRKLIESGDIGWLGALRGDGILLRLGSPLQAMTSVPTVDLGDQTSIDQLYEPPRPDWRHTDLRPGGLLLCRVDEPLRLGSGHAGVIGTLSHLARVGLATHVTSPWVLPGWDGYLTLELHNVGPAVLRLHQGMPVARLLLFAMHGIPSTASAHPFYGATEHLGSRYAAEFPTDTYAR